MHNESRNRLVIAFCCFASWFSLQMFSHSVCYAFQEGQQSQTLESLGLPVTKSGGEEEEQSEFLSQITSSYQDWSQEQKKQKLDPKPKKKTSDVFNAKDLKVAMDVEVGAGSLPFVDGGAGAEEGGSGRKKSLLDGFLNSSFQNPEEMLAEEPSDQFIEGDGLAGNAGQWERAARPYKSYRSKEIRYTFLSGSNDQLQWHSWSGTPFLNEGESNGWSWMINFHFLSGPKQLDLPPRLFDFIAGYQKRGEFSEFFSYDLAASVGAYSDFEGSAREGVRFQGHATAMLHLRSNFDFVFGADYLDRDDFKMLPVIGFSFRPEDHPRLRFDLVFPRPTINFVMNESNMLYFGGRLGGGTWAIEFPDETDDVLTYRDYRLVAGFERRSEGSIHALELGFANSRRIEFRNRPDEMKLEDSFFLQYSWVQ